MKEVAGISSQVMSDEEAQPFIKKLEDFQNLGIDQPFKSEVEKTVSRIKGLVETRYPKGSLGLSLYNYLLSRMPRAVYFKTYERLDDEVSIAELKSNPQSHKTFINLLTLAEIKLDTVEKLTDEKKRQVYLEGGCGKATKHLREAWRQEALDMELRYSNGRLMVFTKNSTEIETLLPPSLGSEGFQWFVGFYINFGAATNAEYRNAILLLDDPGVFLHPMGHKDLLTLFEDYVKFNVTTIYATHLPFLIPRSKLECLRLVHKESQGRSRVTEKFWAISDKDILYPLRAALGVTLADSLFVGESTIIAEGVSDRILLHGMMQEFSRRELVRFKDLDNVEVLAGKGAEGAKQWVLFLQIEKLPYVVVLDNDVEGRSAKADFVKDGVPEDRIFLVTSSINPDQQDFDIEDMFPIGIYSAAFHNVHGKAINMTQNEITKTLQQGNEKINNKAKQLFKNTDYKLDKRQIAYEILRIIKSQDKLDQALDQNFKKLFDEINTKIELYEIS